jgi:hypothetical protein
MKNVIIAILIFIFPCYIYGQYLETISLGFNTLNTIIDRQEFKYSYININGYSQYIITSVDYDGRGLNIYLNSLDEIEDNRFFTYRLFESFNPKLYSKIYFEKRKNNLEIIEYVECEYNIGYPTKENHIMTHRYDNEGFIENIFERHIAGYWNTSERIESQDNGIVVYFRNAGEIRRYYNIPEHEQLDFFLTTFVNKIFEMLNFKYTTGQYQLDIYKTDYENLFNSEIDTPTIIDILGSRTKRELAIIRNCLYANHNYNFRNEEWKYFFQKYYKRNYQGFLTEQEALNSFTNNERWLLNLIIECENNIP